MNPPVADNKLENVIGTSMGIFENSYINSPCSTTPHTWCDWMYESSIRGLQ